MMIAANRLRQWSSAQAYRVGCRALFLCAGLNMPVMVSAGDYSDREAAQQVIATSQEQGLDPPAVDGERIVYIMYTSGSSGRPKDPWDQPL